MEEKRGIVGTVGERGTDSRDSCKNGGRSDRAQRTHNLNCTLATNLPSLLTTMEGLLPCKLDVVGLWSREWRVDWVADGA